MQLQGRLETTRNSFFTVFLPPGGEILITAKQQKVVVVYILNLGGARLEQFL